MAAIIDWLQTHAWLCAYITAGLAILTFVINFIVKKAIELLDSDRLLSLRLTPVGVYIGSRQLAKLSGREIPMEIFYHD